ncbi:MAG: polysaccharide biosynthesis tyrosine autokinase [Cyanobacteria bacterium J06634_6]
MDADYRRHVEEFDLERYWLVLKRRWVPATVVFLLCVAGALAAALSRDNLYRSRGSLLLEVDRSVSLTGVGEDISSLEPVGRIEPIENEASLARSSAVLTEVIDELQLKDDEDELVSPQLLRENLSIFPEAGTDLLNVTYTSENPQLSANVVNQLMTSYVARNIARNRARATAAREFVENQLPIAEANLKEAAESLRLFYLENRIVNVESRSNSILQTLDNLDNQANTLEFQLADMTMSIAEAQQLLGLSATQAREIESLSNSTAVQDTLAELVDIQTEIAKQQNVYTELHPQITTLRQTEASLQSLLNRRISEVLAPGSSLGSRSALELGDLQMSQLDSQLTAELVNAEIRRLSLIGQLESINAKRQQLLGDSANLPTLELQQRELQQALDIATRNYDALEQRLQASQLAENQVLATVSIVEEANVPRMSVDNDLPKLMALGILAGAFLGTALAFGLDLLDKSVKTVKDGSALFNYPVLGVIPRYSTPGGIFNRALASDGGEGYSPRIIANSSVKPMAAAAYQMLQSNLAFVSYGKVGKKTRSQVVTITSSVAQEGKSEVCANLAAVMAQTGKRVLLVDADMRSPSQHHLWNADNSAGLSNILFGETDLPVDRHRINENLSLLTAGTMPSNPTSLLSPERVKYLIEALSKQYDYIIIDTPPIAAGGDAAMMGEASDGTLLVFRPRWVDSANAFFAKSFLKRARTRVLGMVANNVNLKVEHHEYVAPIKGSVYPYDQDLFPEEIHANGNGLVGSSTVTSAASRNGK